MNQQQPTFSIGLTSQQQATKRCFDIVVSLIGLVASTPVLAVGWLLARFSSRASGFFVQQRIGLNGRQFPLFKLRTMRIIENIDTTVTAQNDCRITKIGAVLRKLKIDELPQLLNVLLGQMSLVGPRPDVAGFADKLAGEDRVILTVRPGITGPASLAFRNEEELLATADNPERFNREIIWPEKVKLNKAYIKNYSMTGDIKYIWQTVVGSRP